MTDEILHTLLAWEQTTVFAALKPYLRIAFAGLWVGAYAFTTIVLTSDDVLASVRDALRKADVSPKHFTCNKGVVSEKLTGKRPLTLQTLAPLPVEFWQRWAVEIAMRVGVPVDVTVGARLARRQARMSLSHNSKVGAA
jgi:hypothetical protein